MSLGDDTKRYEEKVFTNMKSGDILQSYFGGRNNGAIQLPDTQHLVAQTAARHALEQAQRAKDEIEIQKFRMKFARNSNAGVNIIATKQKDTHELTVRPAVVAKRRKIDETHGEEDIVIEKKVAKLAESSPSPDEKKEELIVQSAPAAPPAQALFDQYGSSDEEC